MSDPILNLSAWIERRSNEVGPYADHIVHSVTAYETHISAQAAEIERLQLFIATEASAAAGRLKAFRSPFPILDDDPVEWMKRMTEGLAEQGDRLAAGITAALSKEGE